MNFYIKLGITALIAVLAIGLIVSLVMWIRSRKARERLRIEGAERLRLRNEALGKWIKDIAYAETAQEVVAIGDADILKVLGIPQWTLLWVSAETEECKQAQKRLRRAQVAVSYESANEARQLDMLFGFLDYPPDFPQQFGITQEFAVERINAHTASVRAAVTAGQPDTVFTFNALRHSRRWSQLSHFGVSAPDCPNNWNELVCRSYRAPAIRDFDGFRSDPQHGIVSQLAAKAIRTRDPVLAKVVMAYCALTRQRSSGGRYVTVHPYREEIGDVLYAQVAKVVDRFHAGERLFGRLKSRPGS